jgi:pectate lyase
MEKRYKLPETGINSDRVGVPLCLLIVMMMMVLPLVVLAQPDESKIIIESDSEYRYIRKLPEPFGFAFIGQGTTGGEGGIEVTVTTAEDLLKYASSNDPYIINVVDTIEIVRGIGNYSETNGAYHLGSNTTLRGVGSNATIMYGGFRISRAENIIIQNLTFDGTFVGITEARPQSANCATVRLLGQQKYKNGECLEPGDKGPTDDAIEIIYGSERIWITQNTFKRYSDEALSMKREASYLTISWNRLDDKITGDRGMMMLLGHSHSHTADRGRLKTTIHHNYLGGGSRHPYARFGKFHVFNNYMHNIGQSGITSATEAQTLVENNYIDNVRNPWRISDSSGEHIGYLVERNNIILNTTTGPTRGELGVEVTDPADFYEYTLDDPADVPALVLSGAGPGVGEFLQILPVAERTRLIGPGNGSIVSRNPAYKWKASAFAEGYQLQIIKGEAGNGTVVLDTIVTLNYVINEDLLEADNHYSWRVRAINRYDEGTWTEYGSFSTSPEVRFPEITLVYPEQESNEVTLKSKFSWEKDDHADSYRIMMASDAGFMTILADTLLSEASILMEELMDSLDHQITYFWRVMGSGIHGDGDWSEVRSFTIDYTPTFIADFSENPIDVRLYQNYPNPFNPQTQIRFSLPEQAHVKLEIFDILGQRVSLLVDEVMSAGTQEVTFDAGNLSSGLYLYRLQSGHVTLTKQMMLMK